MHTRRRRGVIVLFRNEGAHVCLFGCFVVRFVDDDNNDDGGDGGGGECVCWYLQWRFRSLARI